MRHSAFKALVLFAFLLISLGQIKAQDYASIAGVVSDPTGAVIPGVTVTLQNTLTSSTYKATTNEVGSYIILNVPSGPGYKVMFTRDGFNSLAVSDIYLVVSNTRTQNAQLTVGGATQTVEVSALNETVTLNTTDATVGNNIDIALINELPIYNRDTPAALFWMQPGVTGNGDQFSVTGARIDQSSVTVDGLDVNDFVTGQAGAIIGRAPVDSVQEFRAEVAGNTASTGTGGGGQYQLVTKSGTNNFHGNLNEYHRDTQMVANSWFNNNTGLKRTPLIRNQFGGNLGGPIHKDKAFFFFDFNNSRIIKSTSVTRTVPLDSFRNGSVSYILNGCGATSRQNTTPACIGSASGPQLATLDPKGIGMNANLLAFVNSRYPHANDLTGGDGINTGYYRFNSPTPSILYNYVGKVDYNLKDSLKVFGRLSLARQDSTQTVVQFASDPVTHPFQDRSYSYVGGLSWTISPTMTNQFTYGSTVTKYNFATTYNPAGTSKFTFGGGTQSVFSSAPFSDPASQKRRVPIPEVRDDFTWLKGSHTMQFGGTFKFIKTNSNLVNDFNFVTVGLGGPTLGLSANLRPANIRTAGTTAAFTWDNAFAFGLGIIPSISSNYNYDNKGNVLKQGGGATRRYRYYEAEAYFGDTWKATRDLSLSYGVRYQLYSVPYETQGLESVQNFTFDNYFAARTRQSASGLSGDSSVPFITYNLGGKANFGTPALYSPSLKDFSPKLAFAYSPSSNKKIVIKGGLGLMYDRTVIGAINFIQDQSSYLFQNSAAAQYGSSSPTASLLNDPRLGASLGIPAPPTANAIAKPYTPYVSGGTPYGLADNQFNTVVDPTLKDPYSIMFNLGVEQELPDHFILKVGYVGRLGKRLLAQADASQLVDFPDTASSQMMSTAFGNMTTALRNGGDPANLAAQPWMEHVVYPGIGAQLGYPNNTSLVADFISSLVYNGDFADSVQWLAFNGLIDSNVGMASQLASNTFITNKGSSAYHGLLATLNKNMSHGLKFDFNYTYSHSIDNVSAVANFIAGSQGYGFLCDARNNRVCRGNSDFDVTHTITGDFIYQLPFGRKRAFAATAPMWVDEVIGGWDISGLPAWNSGTALNTSTAAYVAGYANNAPAIFDGNRSNLTRNPRKTTGGAVNLFSDSTKAQSSFVGPIGFTMGSRNILRGPRQLTMDAGLAKTFPIYGDKWNLKFRADAYNVLNHPVFTTTDTDITSGTFGKMSDVSVAARVMQLALRLEF
jgi:hypothetical protein